MWLIEFGIYDVTQFGCILVPEGEALLGCHNQSARGAQREYADRHTDIHRLVDARRGLEAAKGVALDINPVQCLFVYAPERALAELITRCQNVFHFAHR